jgi:hypothetical protein
MFVVLCVFLAVVASSTESFVYPTELRVVREQPAMIQIDDREREKSQIQKSE